MNDPIVEEVRTAREAIAKKYDFDIHAIVTNVRRRQAKSGHRIQKIASRSFSKTVPHSGYRITT